MDMQHPRRGTIRTHHSLSRLAALTLWSCSGVIAAGLLISTSLPSTAQSQINGRVLSAPQVGTVKPHIEEKPKLPKAPAQVAMPALPPMEYMPGLEEPLVAMGPVDEGETKALHIALNEFHEAPSKAGPQGDYADYAKPLLAFIAAHPKSNWNAALYLNLGLGYYHAGYYSRAFSSFETAWKLGRDATDPHTRLMVDRAVGELAKMHARVGHEKELEALFNDIHGRPIGGPATELIQGAREGLWAFHHNPGEAYLCGPKALENVLVSLKAKPQQIQVARAARSGTHGFSLTQLSALADKAKLKYTLIHREAGQPIPVPSIIHWKVHHYAAIIGRQGDLYQVVDPTFGSAWGSLLTARAIDEEGSGYFLVPQQASPTKPGLPSAARLVPRSFSVGGKGEGWRAVSPKSPEANSVYGMGQANACIAGETMGTDHHMCCMTGSDAQPIRPGMPSSAPIVIDGSVAPQMTVANAHTTVVSLNLSDTPVGYVPQKGVSAKTQITYNQREDQQPATLGFSNLSPKWTHSWLVFLQDDPTPNREGWNVMRYGSGGGGFNYRNVYNRTTGTWPAETYDNSQLFRFPVTGTATSYERHLPDGTKEVYAKFDGATTYPRKVFLTKVIDPKGNTTTLNYDSSLRLTSVVDAMGRSTTFTYGLTSSPLLLTQITDPFGRASQMTYDTSGRLASITDPAGITSSFTYSTTEPSFVNTLTTPYGASTFNDTPNPHDTVETNTRSLTMTDPLGFTDFLYFYQNPNIVPCCDATNTVPSGMSTFNQLLQWRNLFYWDKHAFALGVTTSGGVVQSEDFSKARITHWDHDIVVNADVGRVAGSVKPPLEHRTWFTYWGWDSAIGSQGTIYSGSLDRPANIGRVLDDGTSQVTTATYNSFGLPLTVQDPKGRSTKYIYDTNNIDLLTVQQLTAPSTYTTIAAYGPYNTLHEPQTYTDAAGQVWHYTYNAAGQKTTETDPNGGVTTWNYDSSGRLSNIVNANNQTQASYTYDSIDRIATYTDSEGYTLTYGYDALDRVTSITYPDGTTDLYDYTFQSGPNMGTQSLDLRKRTDRLGRVTTYGFDADRRLTSVTEPTSGTATRTTSYDYYENGTLKDIIDANSNVTHWDVDLESRPTKKTYAFSTPQAQAETYVYESSTSRLHSVTDALGQVKTFTYDIDDHLKAIAYTSTVNPTPNVTYTWDGFFPRMSSMTDGLGTTNFSYTAIGTLGALKLASITGPFGANGNLSFTYDALSRLATRAITGSNETFAYDAISRLTSHGTPLGSFTYGYLGQTNQTASRSVTNGTVTVSTNWAYDTNTNDRRLTTITNSGLTRSYTLGYGSPANPYDIMSITDTAATGHPFASQSHSYGYDNVDRLLSATSTTPGNYSYGYDNLDNATAVTDPGIGSTSPTYNGLNQVQTFATNTYSYDNNGNTTSDGVTKTYKWDAENRLIEIDYIGSTAKSQFSYDAMGRRTVAIETPASGPVTTTRALWCGSRICQTRDGSDNVQSRILNEGEYNAVTAQKAVYMSDQLGSVRDVLDAASGSLISSIDYSPYGNPIQTNGSFVPFYQYAGLARHTQSTLMLSATRAYDPIAGRWINHDPIRELGGINLYAYVHASPINEWDPLGLCDKQPDNCGTPTRLSIQNDATQNRVTFTTFRYQLLGSNGQPLTGSGYSVQEHVVPAPTHNTNDSFVPAPSGSVTDMVGYTGRLPTHDAHDESFQTFTVKCGGKDYELTTVFHQSRSYDSSSNTYSNTVTVVTP